jgi:hypothetical protein
MSVSQTLERALAVIDTPEKWCVGKRDDGFGRHCALGAIDAAGVPSYEGVDEAIVALAKALPSDAPEPEFDTHPWWVATYNNTSDYPTVRAWFQRAIRNAKTAEAEPLAIPSPVTDPVLAA